MADKINFRVFGYCTSQVIHFFNFLQLIQLTETPMSGELEIIYNMKWSYITIWNLVFQGTYAVLGLICDVPVLLKMKGKHKALIFLRWYRSILFSAFLWPCGLFIFTIFWPIFLYDRELVYPRVIDTVVSLVSNHIMHSVVFLIVVWEFIFAEKRLAKPDKLATAHFTSLVIVYTVLMITSYIRSGVWPYPIFAKVYGTIYLPLTYLLLFIYSGVAYYIQWFLPNVLQLNEKSLEKVK